jgi:uridine kinase
MTGDQHAERVARLVSVIDASEPRCGATRLVAIDGPSGAGKTTLARDLADELAAPTIHMDDLYPGWDGLRAAVRLAEQWVVDRLRSGQPARYRRWDWAADAYADWVQLPGAEVVVLEGCGSGARPVGDAVSTLVWVDADQGIRRARGLARDPAYGQFWDRWAAQERELYAADRTAERADLVIDTTPDGYLG